MDMSKKHRGRGKGKGRKIPGAIEPAIPATASACVQDSTTKPAGRVDVDVKAEPVSQSFRFSALRAIYSPVGGG